MRFVIGLVVTFLILGGPMARFLWKRCKGNETYYYVFGFLIMVAMLCLASLYFTGCAYAQTTRSAYDARINVISIPDSAKALAWTDCDSTNKAFIEIDSASWGTDETMFILTHERRHVTQSERPKGGCRAFLKRYNSSLQFKLDTEAEAECAELVVRPLLEQNLRFIHLVSQYEGFEIFPKGAVLKAFQKACAKERKGPP